MATRLGEVSKQTEECCSLVWAWGHELQGRCCMTLSRWDRRHTAAAILTLVVAACGCRKSSPPGEQAPASGSTGAREYVVDMDKLPPDVQKALGTMFVSALVQGDLRKLFEENHIKDEREKELFYALDRVLGKPDKFAQVRVYLFGPPDWKPMKSPLEMPMPPGPTFYYLRCPVAGASTPFALVVSVPTSKEAGGIKERVVPYDSDKPWGYTREEMAKLKKAFGGKSDAP